jgi:hypothetical protein
LIYRWQQQHQQQFIASIVDTSEQLIFGIVDTGDKHKVANISENFLLKIRKGPNGN